MSDPAPTIDPRLQALADRIKTLITNSEYNAAAVARLIEVDPSAVSRWMSGERTPTMKNLIDLAELLGAEVSDLWEGEQAIPTTPEQRAVVERMKGMSKARQQAILAFLSADEEPDKGA